MIYALLDLGLLKRFDITIEKFIETCYKVDAKIVQYRDKISALDEVEKNLKRIRKLWSGILIINDYPQLAEFCDGAHLGQEDLRKLGAVENVREIIGRKILGLSTHNKKEVLEANELDVDYIGLGAYRPTSTKKVKSVGGEKLLEIAKLSKKDVAIIGGVRLDDKIPNVKYRVIGSDLCRYASIR